MYELTMTIIGMKKAPSDPENQNIKLLDWINVSVNVNADDDDHHHHLYHQCFG